MKTYLGGVCVLALCVMHSGSLFQAAAQAGAQTATFTYADRDVYL
jgi:hypothetical protein